MHKLLVADTAADIWVVVGTAVVADKLAAHMKAVGMFAAVVAGPF